MNLPEILQSFFGNWFHKSLAKQFGSSYCDNDVYAICLITQCFTSSITLCPFNITLKYSKLKNCFFGEHTNIINFLLIADIINNAFEHSLQLFHYCTVIVFAYFSLQKWYTGDCIYEQ